MKTAAGTGSIQLPTITRARNGCLCVLAMLALLLPQCGKNVPAETQPDKAVQSFISAIRGSKCFPPNWKDAAIDEIKPLSISGQDLYLCTLKHGNDKAGYAVLVNRGGNYSVVMYSGSSLPDRLVQTLSLPNRDMAAVNTPPPMDVIPDVPMIAFPQMCNERMKVTPLATSIAGMGMWFQFHRRVPFFYHPQELLISQTQPFDRYSPLLTPSPEPSVGELNSFAKARSEIYQDPDIWEPLPQPATTHPYGLPSDSRKKIKDPVIVSERLGTVVRSCLMRDLSSEARTTLIREEYITRIDAITEPYSIGMGTAAVLQAYLASTNTLEQGLDDFARSRGLRSVWRYSPCENLSKSQLPCVLIGPGGQAVLVTGLSGENSEKWVVFVVPETVRPVIKSKEEFEAEAIAFYKANKPPGEPDNPALRLIPQTPESEKKFLEAVRKLDAVPSGEVRAVDSKTDPNQPLAAGIHVARLSLFTDWKAIAINVESTKTRPSSSVQAETGKLTAASQMSSPPPTAEKASVVDPSVLEAIKKEKDPAVRAKMVKRLESVAMQKAVDDYLMELIRSDCDEVRVAAIATIVLLPSSKADSVEGGEAKLMKMWQHMRARPSPAVQKAMEQKTQTYQEAKKRMPDNKVNELAWKKIQELERYRDKLLSGQGLSETDRKALRASLEEAKTLLKTEQGNIDIRFVQPLQRTMNAIEEKMGGK